MIDFPANPTVGQQFIAAGVTWFWDGAKWAAAGVAAPTIGGIGDNRIINGDMRIDQRNNGAATNPVSGPTYVIDRWKFISLQANKLSFQRVTSTGLGLGIGFGYYLLSVTAAAFTPAATDYFQIVQTIEADMISDFAWGTPGAQPVTLSFWAVSSIAGNHSGAIGNTDGSRSYPFTYSLPIANTWTKIVVTIPGETTGTWVLQGNGNGGSVHFDLGSGVNYRGPANAWASANYIGATGAVSIVTAQNANLLLANVKLEIGSVATPFNRQSLARSLADCQRYFQTGLALMTANSAAGQTFQTSAFFPTTMRAAPAMTIRGTNNNTNLTGFTFNNSDPSQTWTGGSAVAAGATIINCGFSANAEL